MAGLSFIFRNLLFLALVTQACSVEPCPEKWFGTNCSLMCHCNLPCKTSGKCDIRDYCLSGWFHEACQYRDLLYLYKDNSTSEVLADYNEHTCLKEGAGSTEVRVGFTRFLHIFFIRLIFSTKVGTQGAKLDLAFNDSQVPCFRGRRYVVNLRVIDFECDNAEPVNVIIVRGKAATYLCDVQVSGGQNLALKQATSMSHVGTDPFDQLFSSSYAVDGKSLATDRCSRTDGLGKTNLTFELVFKAPVLLGHIILYSSSRFRDSLMGFFLLTLDKNNQVIEHYQNHQSGTDMYFILLSHTTTVVASIIIVANISMGSFEICEIEAYGVPVCDPGRFNYACSSSCSCPNQACAVHNGLCVHSCVTGFYGLKCNTSCPENCIPPGICRRTNGACYSCSAGYMGANCDQVCPAGKYGAGCSSTCSSTCKDKACSPSTGYCLACNDGYHGDLCNQTCPESCIDKLCDLTGHCYNCSPGFYGSECSLPCSSACQDQLCTAFDGQCLFCMDGYFGIKCSSMCPVHCIDKKCDKIFGYCDSCESGYFGDDCSVPCVGKCLDGRCDMLNGSCNHNCTDGYFDITCSSTCPATCKNNQCEKLTGLCVACDNAYGTLCSDACPTMCAKKTCSRYTGNCLQCQAGFYGFHCIEKCPANCANQECNFNNGNCTACKSGYHGKFCSKLCRLDCLGLNCDIATAECVKASSEKSYLHLYLAIAAASSTIVVAILLLYRKKKINKIGAEAGEGEGEDDDDDDIESESESESQSSMVKKNP